MIKKTKDISCCPGVSQAIKKIENASKNRKIQTFGPVVNNLPNVDYLARKGIFAIDSLDDFKGDVLATSIRGLTPTMLQEIKNRKIFLLDVTCPIVRKNQKILKKLVDDGFMIVFYGPPDNHGGKMLMGWAGDKSITTVNACEVNKIHPIPQRLAIVSQTTKNQSDFTNFVEEVLRTSLSEIKEICIVNTICDFVRKRQESALELAKQCDLMIVVGGRKSGQTRLLAEACSKIVNTLPVESGAEITAVSLKGKSRIGITSSATTPNWLTDEVISAVNSFIK
jgi:4-hydroxy-3-methylbut-2-enyl diphosphate reductase